MSTDEGITIVATEPADMQREIEMQTGTPMLSRRHHETQRGLGMSAPETADMQRDVEVQTRTPMLSPGHDGVQRGPCDSIAVCLCSCVFFLCCHAWGELLFKVCCVCQFMPCFKAAMMTTPRHLVPQNRIEKFFAFLAKNLAKLWVPTLLILYIQWVLFRPIDVKPHLGTSVIHAFDLQQADAMAATTRAPHLHFNLTAFLLFKNGHDYYNINYKNLAMSVLYAGEKLGPVDDELPSFKQDPHGRTVMRLVFVGLLRNASSTVADMFSSDSDKGLFEMVVRIRVTLAYKSWPYKQDYFTIFDCPLSSPFPQTGEPALSSPAWCKTNDI